MELFSMSDKTETNLEEVLEQDGLTRLVNLIVEIVIKDIEIDEV